MLEEELEFDKEYWLPLGFSSIIATLGLLTGNVVVVIGAMLMAPLFWPLLGVTMATITTRRHLLQKSLKFLFLSIGLAVFISWLITAITPISEISQEIKLRANPTLLDLFIALSTSIIAVLAVSYPQVSNSIAGVAISISLLPPLSVIGISLAFQSWQIFQGALLLFGANISAIVFSGIVTLYFLGVKPHRSDEQKRWRLGMAVSAIFLLLIAIPLTIYFREAIEQAQMRTSIKTALVQELRQLYEDAQIGNLTVNFSLGKNQVNIEATVYLPEGNFFTVGQKNNLTQALGQITNRDINLQLNVVDTLVLRKQEDMQIRQIKQQIENWLTQRISKINPEIEIENMQIYEQTIPVSGDRQTERQLSTDEPELNVILTVRKYNQAPFSFEQKLQIVKDLSNLIKRKINLEIDFIPVTRIKSQDKLSQLKQQAAQVFAHGLTAVHPLAELDSLTIAESEPEDGQEGLHIKAIIWLPISTDFPESTRRQIETDIATQLQLPTLLELRIFRFSQLQAGDSEYSYPVEVLGHQAIPADSSPYHPDYLEVSE